MDTLIFIALLAGSAALVAFPVLLITWSERRERRHRVEEMQRFLEPGPMVLRVAVGRVRSPVWRIATIVGMVVLGLTLPWYAVDVVLLVGAGTLWAVTHQPRAVVTTDDGIVVVATTWRWHPLRVVARVDHSSWRPPVRRLGPQMLGSEVIVLKGGAGGVPSRRPDPLSGDPRHRAQQCRRSCGASARIARRERLTPVRRAPARRG